MALIQVAIRLNLPWCCRCPWVFKGAEVAMTWYNDIPQPLLDLLSDFELHGIGESSIFKDRHHILLDEATFVQSDGYNLMKAIPLIPEGVNREMYQMKFFPKTTDRVMHSLPLTIVFEKEVTVKPKKLLIWNAKDAMIADEIFPMPVHWIFDSQSICIPIQQEQQDQIMFWKCSAGVTVVGLLHRDF